MKRIIFLLAVMTSIIACSKNVTQKTEAELKLEIINTEKAFAAMLEKEGMKKAFLAFADDSAVLLRNNMIFKGKDQIRDYFNAQGLDGVSLLWTPDFVGVAASGDLAYTYGPFEYKTKDSSGQDISGNGIFHTVWKRQEDGTWKFVWD